MTNVKFDPVIIDYPSHYINTNIDEKKSCLIHDTLKKLNEKYKVHIVLNDYIYIAIRKNGIPIDKSLRIKVNGDIYNTIMKANNNELPKYMEIIDAERLDNTEIY